MKKVFKKGLIAFAMLVSLVFINGTYFVFCHQVRTMEKIRKGGKANLYECCSIYTMHMALWMFGWPLSSEAAWECFLLHLPHEKDEIVTFRSGRAFYTPKMKAAIASLADKPYGASVRVAWNGDRDYAFNSPERRAAIAVNACDVTKRKPEVSSVQGIYEVSVTCPMLYPTYSRTNFNLGKFTIVIHEGLFRHLQNRDWLSRYVAEYRMTNLWMLKRKG